MPRIGATLAAFALIACSIAVNVARYPVVWEMANPVSQLTPTEQAAQNEPPEDADGLSADEPRETAAAPAPSEALPALDGNASASSLHGPETPHCSGGVCSLGPTQSPQPPDTDQDGYTYEEQYPALRRKASDVEPDAALAAEPEADPGETPPEYEDFTQQERPTRHGADGVPRSARVEDAYTDAENPSPHEAGDTGSRSSVAFSPPADDAEPETTNDRPSGGAEQVEPSGPYAGSETPGDSTHSEDSPTGDRQPEEVTWPGPRSPRPVVPVVPQGDADRTLPNGAEVASMSRPDAGPRHDVRRLPPVDELNPFLNDGHDPPVPDISGMDYPSTGKD